MHPNTYTTQFYSGFSFSLCPFPDSTLEDILAVARTRPESVEADVVQCDDDEDSSSSDDVSSSGGSDLSDPSPPLTAAPVLVESGTGDSTTAAVTVAAPPASSQDPFAAVEVQKPLGESDEEESSEDNDNGFTFVKEVASDKVIFITWCACLLNIYLHS